MDSSVERRRENRLRYSWPVWFAEDFSDLLSQGQMVDVSRGGAAFTCHNDEMCPCPGQRITARFSIPRFQGEDSFDLASYTRSAKVCSLSLRLKQIFNSVRWLSEKRQQKKLK